VLLARARVLLAERGGAQGLCHGKDRPPQVLRSRRPALSPALLVGRGWIRSFLRGLPESAVGFLGHLLPEEEADLGHLLPEEEVGYFPKRKQISDFS
jgi:hypothetical protein